MAIHHERRGLCPFCSDKGGHLYQNIETKCWICFKCGKRGIGDIEPAPHWLGNRLVEAERKLPADKASTNWFRPIRPERDFAAVEYLLTHQVKLATAEKYRVGVWRDCLVLPILDPVNPGSMLFYQLRGLRKKWFRGYGPRSQVVGIFDEAPRARGTYVIVESIVSALRLCEIVPTIAVCGKHVSLAQAHVLRLLCAQRRAVIWFDSLDSTKQALWLYNRIRNYAKETRVFFHKTGEAGVDPCDISDKQIKGALHALSITC